MTGKKINPVGKLSALAAADLRFRCAVQKLHSLGPRATAEFLGEIGAERGIQTIIEQKLNRYADIDPAALEATDGDKFWPAPLSEVRRTP